jgi:hypothetical protein
VKEIGMCILKFRRRAAAVCLLAAAITLVLATACAPIRNTPAAAAGPASQYVFCYFTNGGEDGLHLALSDDGYHYTALHGGKSYLAPAVGESKLFRDPCILLGPDGVYRMVWTDSWTGVTIGYSSSRDLIHWSPQRAIDVNKNHPTALNTWAPEVHWDQAHQQYIIFWSSTIPGAFPETAQSGDPVTGSDQKYNHRVYCTTTKDFETFTPSRLYFDPGYECIDATVLPADGRFYLIFKDETLLPIARKDLHTAVSTSMEGPFTDVSPAITRNWVEGPTAIQLGQKYVIFFDCYREQHFGAVESTDLKNWTDITANIKLPEGCRHGTVFAVAPVTADALLAYDRSTGN